VENVTVPEQVKLYGCWLVFSLRYPSADWDDGSRGRQRITSAIGVTGSLQWRGKF